MLIGTPDHWHVPMTVDACAAGKDVYVEKPLTHDLAEGQRGHRGPEQAQAGSCRSARSSGRMPHLQKAYEIVKSGQLGEIHKVHLTWNRNADRGRPGRNLNIDPKTRRLEAVPRQRAKDQPFDEYRFRNWRWFWDFGGGIFTDLMVHWIDVVHWYLDLDHPAAAASIGDHFRPKDVWETPDTVQTLLQYPEQGVQAYFEGTFVNARNAAMCEFMGSEATLYIDRGRYEVHPERQQQAASRAS